MSQVVDVRRTTRESTPRVAFDRIARELLGSRYELSLVICGYALARRINIKYRKKTYSPNVLSFALGKHEGEIFLNLRVAAHEASRFDVSKQARLTLLFAHGCLHLAGLRHGPKMERLEQRMVNKYGR